MHAGRHVPLVPQRPASGGSCGRQPSTARSSSPTDPGNPHNGFCDPRATHEQCNYYIAVSHTDKARPRPLGISASTPKDVNVLPTHTNPAPPDGIVTSSLDAVRGQSKKYHMYADKGSSVLLSLEACTGELSLAVCDGSCPQVYPTSKD